MKNTIVSRALTLSVLATSVFLSGCFLTGKQYQFTVSQQRLDEAVKKSMGEAKVIEKIIDFEIPVLGTAKLIIQTTIRNPVVFTKEEAEQQMEEIRAHNNAVEEGIFFAGIEVVPLRVLLADSAAIRADTVMAYSPMSVVSGSIGLSSDVHVQVIEAPNQPPITKAVIAAVKRYFPKMSFATRAIAVAKPTYDPNTTAIGVEKVDLAFPKLGPFEAPIQQAIVTRAVNVAETQISEHLRSQPVLFLNQLDFNKIDISNALFKKLLVSGGPTLVKKIRINKIEFTNTDVKVTISKK